MLRNLLFVSFIGCAFFLAACKKNSAVVEEPVPVPPKYSLSYGDSILYLKSNNGDHIVNPVQQRNGTYTAFPEGIEIDMNTGAINISKSETGLRYRIAFTSFEGDVSETVVLLSGVNYADHYHQIVNGDSISYALYNGNTTMPSAQFDIDGAARAQGLAIDPATGAINLWQSKRNGFFGTYPNYTKKEITIKYKISDASNGAVNSLNVLLYLYKTMRDVPADIQQLMVARQSLFFNNSAPVNTSSTGASAKPRPPCVIVIAQ